jgi:hypothetical protein
MLNPVLILLSDLMAIFLLIYSVSFEENVPGLTGS